MIQQADGTAAMRVCQGMDLAVDTNDTVATKTVDWCPSPVRGWGVAIEVIARLVSRHLAGRGEFFWGRSRRSLNREVPQK